MNMNTLIKRGGIAAVAFVAAAIAGGLASAQDKPTIYVIAPSLTDPFWITEQNGANQAGQDFGVNVVFQAPPQDTGDAGMVPLVQAAIAAKPAGIAIDYTSKTMEAGRPWRRSMPASRSCSTTTTASRARMRPSDQRILGLAFDRPGRVDVGRDARPRRGCRSLPKEPCKVLIVNPFPTAFVLTLRADGVKRALDAAGYPHDDLARPATRARTSR